MAVYGASKAFVLSFSEVLWAEYRQQGIRVLAVCPGPTETSFFDVAKSEGTIGGKKRRVEDVIRTTAEGPGAGQILRG